LAPPCSPHFLKIRGLFSSVPAALPAGHHHAKRCLGFFQQSRVYHGGLQLLLHFIQIIGRFLGVCTYPRLRSMLLCSSRGRVYQGDPESPVCIPVYSCAFLCIPERTYVMNMRINVSHLVPVYLPAARVCLYIPLAFPRIFTGVDTFLYSYNG